MSSAFKQYWLAHNTYLHIPQRKQTPPTPQQLQMQTYSLQCKWLLVIVEDRYPLSMVRKQRWIRYQKLSTTIERSPALKQEYTNS